MKNINLYKTILFAAIIEMTMFASSCKDDNGNNGGAPYISYVRVTNPASADSLLVAAGQGQLIAIVGGNLQNTKQVWFNDQSAVLTPTYITNNTIMVTVPSTIPMDVTDKIKLIFANGDSLLHDFTVTISKPIISTMDCEYVADGGTVTIHGQYLYFPMTVTFPGGVTASSETGEVTANDANTLISVKVPEGAKPGVINVTNNFGTVNSDFWFRDNRNIFEDFEGVLSGSLGNIGTNGAIYGDGTGGTTVINTTAGDPPSISGNYARVKKILGSWAWTQVYARWSPPYCPVPDDAILHPKLYNFKFEVCTTKPFNANGVQAWVTSLSKQNGPSPYLWGPPLDTKGAWQTVSIPFEDFATAHGSDFPGVSSDGTYFSGFVFLAAGTLDCDMSFDNFRIVLKTIPGNNP